jgi:hypothetical protein
MFAKGLNLSLSKLSVARLAASLAPVLTVSHRSDAHFQSLRLHGCHFRYLLSPILLLSSLRASVTQSSIQNVQADHVIEASYITSPLIFSLDHCPVVVCRSCLFRMLNVQSIITIHSPDNNCSRLEFVGCAIVDSNASDTVTRAHELVMQRSSVDRVSGMFADSKLTPGCAASFNDTAFVSCDLVLKTWLYAPNQVFQSVNVTKGGFDCSPLVLAADLMGQLRWSCCEFHNISIVHYFPGQCDFVMANVHGGTEVRVERCTFSDIRGMFLFFVQVGLGSPTQPVVFEDICVCRSGTRFATTTYYLGLMLINCVFDVIPEVNWNENDVYRTGCVYDATGCGVVDARNGTSTRAIHAFDYVVIAAEAQEFKPRH